MICSRSVTFWELLVLSGTLQ